MNGMLGGDDMQSYVSGNQCDSVLASCQPKVSVKNL